MIYITGDTHGDIDFKKLTMPFLEKLTKEDYVIIAGDCGVLFDEKNKIEMIKKYSSLSFTILFVDGNHENFDLLNSYQIEEWHGGKVHKLSEKLIHLMRGQVFDIEGLKFFTFGGGLSIDKKYRTPYKTWWPEEMPTNKELNEALVNLEKYDFTVDYVITHDCPSSLLSYVLQYSRKGIYSKIEPAQSNIILEEILNKIDFKQWFFGHYHIDHFFGMKFIGLYYEFIEIKDGKHCN